MDIRSSVLAILVGGSPAPGINSVISAVAIEAINNGIDVIGIKWGFKRIKLGQTSSIVVPLTLQSVSSLHAAPGSVLYTSRQQLCSPQEVDNVIRSLEYLRVRYLVTIGGVDTAQSALLLSTAAAKASFALSLVHVPKTVYNDLPMPAECITFGFTTARDSGLALCQNYRVDAKTLGRWYIVSVIGQRAGHLAEGIGKGSAATVTLIPEEFTKGDFTFSTILDIVEATMIKRLATGRDYGVVVLTEGLVGKLPDDEVRLLFGSIESGYGILSKVVRDHVAQRLLAKGIDLTVCSSAIGSELRSAPPNSTDINLARDLGYGATRYLISGKSGGMVGLQGGDIVLFKLDEIQFDSPGHLHVRLVDLKSGSYEVARKYQIRLKKTDLEDVDLLKQMSEIAGVEPMVFVSMFSHCAE